MSQSARPTRQAPRAALAALMTIFLAAGGCGRQDAAPAAQDQASAAALPATEYFEGLTEEAFSASDRRLDVLISLARNASARDRRTLPLARAAELDTLLAAINRHRASMNRADLAIASVEAYRLFVSAMPSSTPIPTEVSLLDYAGFRFGADLNADPPRWGDAASALDFADAHWSQISGRVTDAVVRNRFNSALLGMRTAIDSRDLAAARQAGLRELDLVDELETWFSRPAVGTSTPAKGAT